MHKVKYVYEKKVHRSIECTRAYENEWQTTVQPAAIFTLSFHDFIELTNWVHDCMINISRSYVLIYYNYSRFFILLNSPNVMNTISNFFASLVSSSARDITFVLNTNVSSRKTYYMNRQTIAIVPSSLIYVYLCHCP